MCAASLFATSCFNLLRLGQVLLVAEGLFAVHVSVPPALVGRRLGDADIRGDTGLSVVAVSPGEAQVGPGTILPAAGTLTLAGPENAVNRWFARYQSHLPEDHSERVWRRIIPALRTRRL
jgi:uncharacterized protein with PhoU and TrkA domain